MFELISRKPFHPEPNKWSYFPELTIGNVTLWPGDAVRLAGKRNKTYQFQTLLTNTETDKQSVVVKGPVTIYGAGAERVVELDQIRIIPKRRRRRK